MKVVKVKVLKVDSALFRRLAVHFHFHLFQAPGGLAITTGEGVVPGARLWHLDKWVLLVANYAKSNF